MARVMKDATVAATAQKLFHVCGPTWLEDSYYHWSAVAKAWAVGATRPLSHDDRQAILYAIQELDDAEMARRRALEDEHEDDDGEALDEIELKDDRQQELF